MLNQREFKFRAWDEDLGMSEPFGLEGAGIMFLEGGNPDSIMQFTGLKDKNGKEIYEGDIVKWGHIDGGKENSIRIAVVEINPDIQFRCKDKVYHYGNFMYKDTEKYLEKIGDKYTIKENGYITANDKDVKEAIERCNKKHEKALRKLGEK